MATLEGEERLMIVFADVHYYFSAPVPKPPNHRFEKGSYLYLHGNKTGSGARLEVANNAGTPDQDAFTGALDQATIRQSYKHPTLCTITVNSYPNQSRAPVPPVPRQEHHWRLPNTEPRAERTTLQSLHTVDVYFWTAQDADSFIGNVRRLLQHDQVQLLDQPPAQAPRDKLVSPVVQQLENAAIEDPTYQGNKIGTPSGAQVTQGRQETPKSDDPATFKPLAYNPAAPPAPEPIRHREKTPPPIDAETGTGLGAVAYADQLPSVPQSSVPRPPHGSMPHSQGYVPQAASQTSSVVSPNQIPSALGQRASSVSSLPPPPPLSPPNQGSPSNLPLAPTASAPSQQQGVPKFDQRGNPLPSPASQVIGSSYVSGSHQPLQHVQPQYADYLGSTGHQTSGPIGGYSNYSYTQKQQQTAQSGDFDIHNQLYRPTEVEAKYDYRPRLSEAGPGKQPGKVDQQTNRVDKGVNRLFKKIEKRIG